MPENPSQADDADDQQRDDGGQCHPAVDRPVKIQQTLQSATRDEFAVAERDAARGAGLDRGVSRFGGGDRLAFGTRTDRDVAGHLVVLDHRRHVGSYPVKVAAFGPVFDQAIPGAAGFDGCPKIGERLFRHVRMAHDVVRRADQFLIAEAADLGEDLIGECDVAGRVGAWETNGSPSGTSASTLVIGWLSRMRAPLACRRAGLSARGGTGRPQRTTRELISS